MSFPISVVIPTYNRAGLVVRALESVLAQTYPAHEVIIVDDGSTDETADAFRPYVERGQKEGPPVRYIHQENQGQSGARNRGVQESRGEWIAFLDSDDVWLPEKLEWQLRALEQYKGECSACFTNARFVNYPYVKTTAFEWAGKNHKSLIGKISDPVWFIVNDPHGVYVQTLLLHADLWQRTGGFDLQLRAQEDTDFLFRLALATRLCYVNLPLVDIDKTPNRAVRASELFKVEDILLPQRQYMLEKWLQQSTGLDECIRKSILTKLQGIHARWANYHLAKGDYQKARAAMSKAATYGFASRLAVKRFLIAAAPKLLRRVELRRRRMQAEHNFRGEFTF
jgi:glycosyltransferase involved in cell wall biosynthesis